MVCCILVLGVDEGVNGVVLRTFIRHKGRRYKIETETDRIKTRFKKKHINSCIGVQVNNY